VTHGLLKTVILSIACIFTSGIAFATDLDEKIRAGVENGDLPGLHSVIVEIGDKRLAETYFDGEDEIWGDPIGMIKHGPDTLHDLRSITKPIVGLLYGIALAEGKVPALDQPLYAHFPQYPDLKSEEGREKILVEHALAMQMGLEWNEELPYTDPRNSEVQMYRSKDRYRFALEQKMVLEPGTQWTYSGGAVNIVGKLITDGTGMPLDEYAKQKLFTPLGITGYEWLSGTDGDASAASGLRMKLNDLIAIGKMIAQDGKVNDKQIVPASWLKEMLTPRSKIDEYTQYGLLWYVGGTPDNVIAIGVGNGGQRLTVQPKHQFVVASFSGQYNDPNSWQTSLKVMLEYAVPAAKQAQGK